MAKLTELRMFPLILSLVLLERGSAGNVDPPSYAGKSKPGEEGRIFYGEEAVKGEFLYVVSLENCSRVLVGKLWVLSSDGCTL